MQDQPLTWHFHYHAIDLSMSLILEGHFELRHNLQPLYWSWVPRPKRSKSSNCPNPIDYLFRVWGFPRQPSCTACTALCRVIRFASSPKLRRVDFHFCLMLRSPSLPVIATIGWPKLWVMRRWLVRSVILTETRIDLSTNDILARLTSRITRKFYAINRCARQALYDHHEHESCTADTR